MLSPFPKKLFIGKIRDAQALLQTPRLAGFGTIFGPRLFPGSESAPLKKATQAQL
jgi:hypothetical protein